MEAVRTALSPIEGLKQRLVDIIGPDGEVRTALSPIEGLKQATLSRG